MKFFKKSAINFFKFDEENQLDLRSLKELYVYNCTFDNSYFLNKWYKNIFNYIKYAAFNKSHRLNELSVYSNKHIETNPHKLINFLVKHYTKNGNKIKGYNLLKSSFYLFFSFFEKFDTELDENYTLYKLYYQYSQENRTIFYNPVFIYINILKYLESTFNICIKTVKKGRKKSDKSTKELKIGYISPNRRLPYALRTLILFSKQFDYQNAFAKTCYNILYLFLSNKNSVLFKKKIAIVDKLLKLRKLY